MFASAFLLAMLAQRAADNSLSRFNWSSSSSILVGRDPAACKLRDEFTLQTSGLSGGAAVRLTLTPAGDIHLNGQPATDAEIVANLRYLLKVMACGYREDAKP